MELLVISSTIMSFFLVVILFGHIGIKADKKAKRLDFVNDLDINVEFDEFSESFYKRFIYPYIKLITKAASKWMPKQKSKSIKEELIEKQLRLAGIYITASEFSFIKMMVSLVVFFVFIILTLFTAKDFNMKLLIMLSGIMVALLIPRYFLKARIKNRQDRIRKQLPEVFDLLGVCIEAGLSFDSSLLKISEKLKGPFVDEMLILYREIQMGRPRREALKNLGECSSIQELKTFASSMAQADQLGIPINNVLKVQAAQLRMSRKQQAQEKGMKAPVKMMIPMVAFVFPVIFIILLGPTVIQLISEFG